VGEEGLPDLLLIHSLGTGLRMWDRQIEAFSAVRRILAFDLPGHGESSAASGDYRLDDLGADVLGVADAAGLDRFDVCGTSIGGLIGVWLAINHPDRVISLVAAGTAARLGSQELWSDRIEAVAAGGMEAIRAQVIRRFFAADFSEREPAVFAKIERMFIDCDPVGYMGCCAALRDADLRPEVMAITCPTLVLCGSEDVAAPPAQGQWLQRHIDGSRLEMIDGAGHLPNLDQPEAFDRLVLAALTGG
jgi:3-oxoadipate enol-lactonase